MSARAPGTPALPFRSAWAVLAAAGIYGDIARKVAALGEHAWDHRLKTGGGQARLDRARLRQALSRKRLYAESERPAGLGQGRVNPSASPVASSAWRTTEMTMLSLQLVARSAQGRAAAERPEKPRRLLVTCCASAPPRTMPARTISKRCCASQIRWALPIEREPAANLGFAALRPRRARIDDLRARGGAGRRR
jgi:hypothetical protein